MQLAVYPSGGDNVGPDDYPYILDFEPKKRELFEAVTEGSENLSGSSGKTEITKGSTSVNGLELDASAGFSVGPFGASGSVKNTSTDTTINQNTTDTSREARETLSRTTQSSQMYQLFNGYHLGGNRALFVIAPRPHTVSDQSQTEFNLIDGARKLEGIQEVFVVVHMPRHGRLLHTGGSGHRARGDHPRGLPSAHGPTRQRPAGPLCRTAGTSRRCHHRTRRRRRRQRRIKQLVVTRRIVQSCGTFDQNGLLQIQQLGSLARPWCRARLPSPTWQHRRRTPGWPGIRRPATRAQVASTLNAVQSQINRLMLDRNTAVGYEPREFVDTDTFKALVANTGARGLHADSGCRRGRAPYQGRPAGTRVTQDPTMSDLFSIDMSQADSQATADIRQRVIDNLAAVPQGS